jgi:predicted N-acetyltransferase YhbS
MQAGFTIRRAHAVDLDEINRVIEAAVMNWSVPERVKRLSLQSCRYVEFDFQNQQFFVAVDESDHIIAVAVCERADVRDTPDSVKGMLLHGLYVDPDFKGRGAGSALIEASIAATRRAGLRGLLVKAHKDAVGFFVARGFRARSGSLASARYPYLYWLSIDG